MNFRILLLLMIACCVACKSEPMKDPIRHDIDGEGVSEEDRKAIITEILTRKPSNFFDSVYKQVDIPIEEMKKYTNLDAVYYNKTDHVSFSGDTAFAIRESHIGVIITYNDGLACQLKFLFLFERGAMRSSKFMEIQKACDFDLSSYNETTEPEFTSDTSFNLVRTIYPSETKQKIEKEKKEITAFLITRDGQIVERSN